jgi:hypothetical protein
LLARWSSRELSELQILFLVEDYESKGIELMERDGSLKSMETLKQEAIMKDLQARAEAGLKSVRK